MKVSNPIEMHHFAHPLYSAKRISELSVTIELPISSNLARLHREDVIALAKHFNLTESDLNTQGDK